MRQYSSSRMWSITQPLFGRLEQRVVEEEHESPARLEHARDLGDRRPVIGDVLEHEAHDRRVERAVGERELIRARADVRRPTCRARARRRAARRVGSTPATSSAPASPRPARAALTGPDVDDAARAREALRASGRICSSYSGSAPSVKPSCHQPACCSQKLNGFSGGDSGIPPILSHRRAAGDPGAGRAHRREPRRSRTPAERQGGAAPRLRSAALVRRDKPSAARTPLRDRPAACHARPTPRRGPARPSRGASRRRFPSRASRAASTPLTPAKGRASASLRLAVCAKNGSSPTRMPSHRHQTPYGTSATPMPFSSAAVALADRTPHPGTSASTAIVLHEDGVRHDPPGAAPMTLVIE